MDCTSEVHQIPGLTFRRRKGLRRPTHEIPGLGTLEYVRDERGHSWQLSHKQVPTRMTLVDGVFGKNDDPAQAIELMATIATRERQLRQGVMRARYFEFVDPIYRQPPFDDILANLDDWIVPYRIDRWGEDRLVFSFDCCDAPGQQLVGAAQIRVSVDADWSAYDVRYFTSGLSDELQVSAYRQRILPEGFVADSIADQFIGTPHVKPTPDLALLLAESIAQTHALMQESEGSARAFLRCAHALLCHRRESRFEDLD